MTPNNIIKYIIMSVWLFVNVFILIPCHVFAIAKDPMKQVIIHDEPIDIEGLVFVDGENKAWKLEKNKTNIVYFFASWCGDCLEEVKLLQKLDKELHKRIKNNNFEIVFVSVDFKKAKEVIEILEEYDIKNIKVVFDPKQNNMKKLDILSIPTSIIVNEKDQEIIRAKSKINWLQQNFIDFLIKNIAKTTEK